MTFPRKIREGQHLVVDDRTGFTIWSGDTAEEELTNYSTRKQSIDPRHPQEIVRAPRAEKQSVDNPRPIDPYVFNGALTTTTTAAASAGTQTLTVDSTSGFASGNNLRIMLQSGDTWPCTVDTVASTTSFTIVETLPDGVESGALVTNLSVITEPSY